MDCAVSSKDDDFSGWGKQKPSTSIIKTEEIPPKFPKVWELQKT